MHAYFDSLVDRAESVPARLPEPEQRDGRRLIQMCREIAQYIALEPGAHDVSGPPSAEQLTVRQELGRLVEFLARRHASGIPLAALGRAALARVAGSSTDFDRLCQETDSKLSMLGF